MDDLPVRIMLGFLLTLAGILVLLTATGIMYVFGWWILLLIPIVGIGYVVGTLLSYGPNFKKQVQKDYKKLFKRSS